MARRLLFITGLGLIILGLALRFVIVPGMMLLPADLSVVRTYEGKLVTMLDPATFGLYQDLPVRIARTLRVEKVQRALAVRLLPDLPDPVPLNYAYISDLTL
jgi:hypothetical protein